MGLIHNNLLALYHPYKHTPASSSTAHFRNSPLLRPLHLGLVFLFASFFPIIAWIVFFNRIYLPFILIINRTKTFTLSYDTLYTLYVTVHTNNK